MNELESIDPFSEALLQRYSVETDDEISRKLTFAQQAQREWSRSDINHRVKVLRNLKSTLDERKQSLAEIITREMGKPFNQSISEIEKCAWVCDYYADHAESLLSPREISTDYERSIVAYEPLGVILAIMPWNFPFWQVFRFLAPSILAGNSIVLKHASNVTGCALAIENCLQFLDLPKALLQVLRIQSKQVASIIEDRRISGVTLTGSTQAGKAVAKIAGENLKKSVLELGGSDPYLILEDADLDRAADACVTSRLINSGQSCIAAKRFITVASIYDEFREKLIEHFKAKKFGNPMDPENSIGPMARLDLRDELHQQVTASVEKGAQLDLGGEVPKMKGYFYPPTVLSGVTPDHPAFHEELFGPVACLIQARSTDHAIELANQTVYGLGAAVFTKNLDLGFEIAQKRLQAGCCFVNEFVKSDPRLPFGGIKESGYGRELSEEGIREFMNIKTVVVKSTKT